MMRQQSNSEEKEDGIRKTSRNKSLPASREVL